jgi:hypothetical protein
MIEYRHNEFSDFPANEKRIFQWMQEYEIVTISAWRNMIMDQHPECPLYYEKLQNSEQIYTRNQRDFANQTLIWMLNNLQYGVIQVQGGFPGQTYFDTCRGVGSVADICEFSYIVVNLPQENGKIDKHFKENMKKIAAYFNQDSIGYLAPRDKFYYLLYTNDKFEFGTEKFLGKLGKRNHIGLKLNNYFTKIQIHSFEEPEMPQLMVGKFYKYFKCNIAYLLKISSMGYGMSRTKSTYETLLSLGISDCRKNYAERELKE